MRLGIAFSIGLSVGIPGGLAITTLSQPDRLPLIDREAGSLGASVQAKTPTWGASIRKSNRSNATLKRLNLQMLNHSDSGTNLTLSPNRK
jgi:hypothetical protein